MEKGIPLPEFPLDPPSVKRPPDPRAPLMHGIVWAALGGGAALALGRSGRSRAAPMLWPLPLPMAFLGVGLILLLRPCLRSPALRPPPTPGGPTSGSSRGAASRPMTRRSPSWCGAIVAPCFAPCHSRPGVRAGSGGRRPGRDASRASRAASFRGEAKFGSWVYRIAFNHALNVKARVRYRAPHVSDTCSRPRRRRVATLTSGCRTAAPAGRAGVRWRAARRVPVRVASALLAGCERERDRGVARRAGEHREVIPPPCQAVAARHACRARLRCTMTKRWTGC